jgi:hypothetical protein
MSDSQGQTNIARLEGRQADLTGTMGNEQSKVSSNEGTPNKLKKKASLADVQRQGPNQVQNELDDQPVCSGRGSKWVCKANEVYICQWVTAHLSPKDYKMNSPSLTHPPPVATPSSTRKAIYRPSPLNPNRPDADEIRPAPCRSPPPIPVHIDPVTGHSNVTGPAKPPAKFRLSQLIDLDDLDKNGQVRSPSGQMMSVAEARLRDDRPASIRERQEAIKRNLELKAELMKDPTYRDSIGNKSDCVATKRRSGVKETAKKILQCCCQGH